MYLRLFLMLSGALASQGVRNDKLQRRSSSVNCIVRSETEGSKVIQGVAFSDDELFVVRSESSAIEVYGTSSEETASLLSIAGLKYPADMAFSSLCNAIYLADVSVQGNSYIHKLKMDDGMKERAKWTIEEIIRGVSIAGDGCSSIATLLGNKLLKLSPEGEAVLTITFPDYLDVNLLHAVELSTGQFVVAFYQEIAADSKVCLVLVDIEEDQNEVEGSLGDCFTWPKSEGSFFPVRLAVDAGDNIVVVDTYKRVVKLDSSMNLVEVVLSPDQFGIWVPNRIFLDEANSRFYLSVWNAETGKGKIEDCQEN